MVSRNLLRTLIVLMMALSAVYGGVRADGGAAREKGGNRSDALADFDLATVFADAPAFRERAKFRDPIVLAIAPDLVSCDNPDDPDNVEDVQIAGHCFLGRIRAAFLATNPDGTG